MIREGIRQEIPAAELVTGDLVDLEAGAQVPADIRLTRSSNLQVEESALTGESVPVEKDALFLADCRHEIPLAERVNMVYMSTVVTHGHGEGIVTATGMATEIGRIASMITDAEEEMTPLQKRLGDMGKLLSIFIAGSMCGIVSAGGISTQKYSGNAAGGDFPGGGCGAGRSAGSGDDLSGIVSDQNGQSTYDHPQTAFR